MGALFSQIFALLTAPPGNFIYHLVLVFSIASALQSSFIHWRSSEFPQARRTMLGLGLLLAAQLLLFIFSGLSWLGFINPTWQLASSGSRVHALRYYLDHLVVGLPGAQPLQQMRGQFFSVFSRPRLLVSVC